MNAAGFVLTGMRKCRSRAHPPMILAHSLTSDFFGIEEREAIIPTSNLFMFGPRPRGFFGVCGVRIILPGRRALANCRAGAIRRAAA
ncbi:MAG: hypothetical protein DLM68_16650 [Hyphomicrobiales bacterium]|nr:MAG: hypothetical protein DLM68_16650 [Hyphomicrobiales bacterium]